MTFAMFMILFLIAVFFFQEAIPFVIIVGILFWLFG